MNNKADNFLYEDVTYKIRGCVFEVYKNLGSGHKEKVYELALANEFTYKKVDFVRQKRITVFYKNEKVGVYVPDFVIEEKIVLEIKAKPFLHKQDVHQFWQYLKGTDYKLGLLVNFGSFPKAQIIRRIH